MVVVAVVVVVVAAVEVAVVVAVLVAVAGVVVVVVVVVVAAIPQELVSRSRRGPVGVAGDLASRAGLCRIPWVCRRTWGCFRALLRQGGELPGMPTGWLPCVSVVLRL